MSEPKACYHCGDDCLVEIKHQEKVFCCNGCKMVFEILSDSGMDQYYTIESKPGIKPVSNSNKYQFLDNDTIAEDFYDFKSENHCKVTLFLPQIHCSSCVWLLENLHLLNDAVSSSEVHFTKKEAYINFNPNKISLKELSHLLDKIGYAPTFEKKELQKKKSLDTSFIVKIGVTGFCFGNIMLLSFPDYLGIGNDISDDLAYFMQIIIFLLSLPILFLPAWDYIKSGYKSIKTKHINIDVPVSIGIITLYLKSVYDIFFEQNASYMDSFAAFIFFLLIGKWFQNKTYNALSFERDYKSYFPIAVSKIKNDVEEITPINEIEKNDILVIRNGDIIPTDCVLVKGLANMDYSFVTGESLAQPIKIGEKLYAGGKQVGANIQVNVLQKVNQSYLTHLWNQSAFEKEESKYSKLNTTLSKYFTIAIIIISFFAAITWFFIDSSKIVNVVVSILIVACPCALALSVPFTFGSALRFLGRKEFYLRNVYTVEDLAQITDIVFDKTGTITYSNSSNITYFGEELKEEDKLNLVELSNNSTHILSRNLCEFLQFPVKEKKLTSFQEVIGMGTEGKFKDGNIYKIGSAKFLGENNNTNGETRVYIQKNDSILGYYLFKNLYRKGFQEMIDKLKQNYSIHILSGDNEMEKINLSNILHQEENILFNQKPIDKLKYIQELQNKGRNVLMMGDGLNDAGALKQSNVGIVLSENIYNFSPASDAILSAKKITLLPSFLHFTRKTIHILKYCFSFSLLYNTIGLAIAISGNLTPLIAAILMPISSISVVFLAVISVQLLAKKI